MTQAFSHHISSVIPSLDDKGQSSYFLVLVRTPSATNWNIARYDAGYRKDRPWRTTHNHGVEIIEYYSLPETK